jgi:integrase
MTPTKKRRFGRVRKLPSGRWQVRYRGPDGADHPAPTTFAAKRDAERFLALVEADVTQGRWIAPQAGRTTVAEWADEWFAASMPTLKAKTRHTYRSLLTRMVLPRFGNVTIAAVLPMTVGRWVADLTARVGPSQVRQAYRLLSQIMDSAVDNGLIAVTPCRGVKLPRLPEPDPTILTAKHVDRLVAELSPPDDLLVLVLAYGGLRIGEALCLRRRHIDLVDGRVMVAEAVTQLPGGPVIDTPKSHQRRQLALPAFVVERLGLHLADLPDRDEAFLFPGRQQRTADRPQSYNGWKYRFDRAVERAGLADLIPHDLRATHGSWVADSHGVLVAARRLGHSNASVTTRHYARAVDGRDADVAVFLDRARSTGTAPEGARNGHDEPAEAADVREKRP